VRVWDSRLSCVIWCFRSGLWQRWMGNEEKLAALVTRDAMIGRCKDRDGCTRRPCMNGVHDMGGMQWNGRDHGREGRAGLSCHLGSRA